MNQNIVKPINKKTEDILLKYSKGETKFKKQNLAHLNLSGMSLKNIDLSETDLTCANLSHTDLSGANLSKCCLKGANLKNCNLTGAILNQADLSQANLKNANLSETRCKKTIFYRSHLSHTNLQRAYFPEANLVGASLNESDLSYAHFHRANLTQGFLTRSNLTKTNFQEAILSNACLIHTVISKTLFKGAQYNMQTLFDHHFIPEKYGMTKDVQISVVEIVNSLNYLSQIGCRYLGVLMAVKYWEKSRPECDWIKNFKITNKGLIHYQGKLTEVVDSLQLKWYQQWVTNYIKNCSIIISQFEYLLEEDKFISLSAPIFIPKKAS